jgi:hypothetical protein
VAEKMNKGAKPLFCKMRKGFEIKLRIPMSVLLFICLSTAAIAQNSNPSSWVKVQDGHFVQGGKPLKLYGYTFYPSPVGGSSAWRKPTFTKYIDHILALAAEAGQNMARPTDYWDKSHADQKYDDPLLWKNMDYLIAEAKKRGGFVLMDLSAYRKLLLAKGEDPFDATKWIPYIDWVAARYLNEPTIAFYSIVGEPDPPKSREEADKLVEFYRKVTEELRKADQGHHLITAGGFNHMGDEKPDALWWHRIYTLPANDIVAFKTYSQHDLDLFHRIGDYARQIKKPLCDEEFGMPQSLGDGDFSGQVTNGIKTSRAKFFDNVYLAGEKEGVESFVFWNLGCEIKEKSYEVSPRTPAVWKAIQSHSPFPLAKPGEPQADCEGKKGLVY